ncbi:MAG TPA: hypothetical protein DCQ33_03755 [Nitrospira sp.]|nr:hypothetical protein [Nitrospira sp.]
MTIRMAHLREQGVDFVVFDADARIGTDTARAALLFQLTAKARMSRCKVDKAALQYVSGGQLQFYGTPDLVDFLASVGGVDHWTHQLSV